MERLSAFESQEHPLEPLVGTSYQATTLRQLLGQLERIEAAPWLRPILLPAPGSRLVSVDGPMIAYWSRQAMPKGKITMRGRLMAGSQVVSSHEATGQAVSVAYDPPDLHWSQLVLASCQAMAQAFDEVGWGLLCMLDDNEPNGLESVEATAIKTLADGTRLYEGPWQVAREGDARHVVIVAPQTSQTLVYWGSPKVKAELEAGQWPERYRARPELQANAFKRMIEHGALDINVGRKTILGPDRHQQRAEAKVRDSLEVARRRGAKTGLELEAKRTQVAQSATPGHGKRLEQRQRAAAELEAQLREAQQYEAHVREHVDGFEAPKERADRDVRQQTLMTRRTLLLENLLQALLSVWLAVLPTPGSVEQVVK